MRFVLASVLVVAACEPAELAAPDAAGPSLVTIWDPRACAGDAGARVEVRIEDGDGRALVGADACVACRLELVVDHVGWYAATAVALDAEGGGTALARSTLAIDAPRVRWVVPWPE